ncbi:MAG: glycosyltransferase family 4 protein [Verrucomicrobiota bacterium]|nr:glycosyltransferase family 4 protein [Verrucomicrobiota bacterium]
MCSQKTRRKVVLLKGTLRSGGGLEKSTYAIARAFASQGDEVTILTAKAPSTSLPFSIQTLPVLQWPPSLRLEHFDRKVADWLSANQADLVLGMERNRKQTHLRAGNGVHAAWLQVRRALEGQWRYRLSLINPLHRKILEIEKSAFEDPGLRRLIVNSCMVKEELLSFYKVDPGKIAVVPNGVEWSAWQTAFDDWKEGRKRALLRWELDSEKLHLLFIGHGYLRKGLDLLLQALSLWENREVHLSVVGKEKDMARYLSLVKALRLEKRVRFFGPQSETLSFYQMADALIIPSWYDPCANVTLEALAMGLFVLSSRANGAMELLPKKSGALIDDLCDPEALLALLRTIPRKTAYSAEKIRQGISHLDAPLQLQRFIEACR